MRFALAFREPDVDGLLASVDADQYAEWQAFFALEPVGWPATQMEVKRLVWAIFQSPRSKKVGEFDFETAAEAERISDAEASPKLKQARNEMDAIRANVAASIAAKKKAKHVHSNEKNVGHA